MSIIWKPLKNFESTHLISNLGNVKCISTNKLLNILKHSRGYNAININVNKTKNHLLLHRLLAINFIDNPNNYTQVNHINGIKTDNRLENLEWITPSNNMKHAFKTGLLKVKYNPLYDIETGKRYNSTKEAAEMLGINYGTLKGYLNGKCRNKTSLRKVIYA